MKCLKREDKKVRTVDLDEVSGGKCLVLLSIVFTTRPWRQVFEDWI
jgi:hypothetical protein